MQPFTARVVSGLNTANQFTQLEWANVQLRAALGMAPWPGTLNLRLPDGAPDIHGWLAQAPCCPTIDPAHGFCSARCQPVRLNDLVPGLIVVPEVEGYPRDKVEIVSGYQLRAALGLEEGEEVSVSPLTGAALFGHDGAFEGICFDLEGTLVDFQWKLEEAEAALRDALAGVGLDREPLAGLDYAQLRRHGYQVRGGDPKAEAQIDAALDPIYDTYDADALSLWRPRTGAGELLDLLRQRNVPCALVSNIGRKASRALLERFGWGKHFQAIVTRNDVRLMKPDGEGIRKALHVMGARSERSLMVGDSMSDLLAARNAGVRCALLHGGETRYRPLDGAKPQLNLSSLEELEGMIFWGGRG